MSVPYPKIEASDKLEFKLVYKLFDQTCINTFHYLVRSTYVPSVDLGIDDCMSPFIDLTWTAGGGTHISDITSVDLTAMQATGQVIAPTRQVLYVSDMAASPGQINSPAEPPTTTVVLRRQGAEAGRGNRGRVFIPGIPGSSVLGGKITAAVHPDWLSLSDILTQRLDFTKGAAHLIADPVLFSRPALNPTIVIQSTVDDVLRVQRRREIGRGI